MTENMYQALLLLGQGMAGIFVVLGVIALLVRLMGNVDQGPRQ
ncbi:MAG: OadG-related small transporter subunit [Lawsonibacter sp.]